MGAVSEFKYLGRLITDSENDWLAVIENLRKAWRRWSWMLRILGRYVSDPWTSGNFYKEVVQATLLCGAETWVISPKIWRTLGRLHHRVARRLAKMHPSRDMPGRWF